MSSRRGLRSPHHLAQLAHVFERIRNGEEVRVVVSLPPRHGKTETIMHGLAFLLRANPSLRLAYISAVTKLAAKKSKSIKRIAESEACGVPMDRTSKAREDWRTGVHDGGLWATGVDGQINGEGFNVLVIDDPFKGRSDAESPSQRERVYEWFTDDAYTRVEPHGSVIVCHTRWHQDDLAGRLIATGEWEHIHLPAVNDQGNALWPEQWPLQVLNDRRRILGEYGWASLFQGSPLPRGGSVFNDVRYYDSSRPLPPGCKYSIGIDVAYTAKTYSDYCVAVVMAQDSAGTLYIVDVKRAQATTLTFATTLRMLHAAYPGARTLWYTSTTELGVADLLRAQTGMPIVGEIATADKFVRAQPVAAAWNAGRILLPKPPKGDPPEWVEDFVQEVTTFSGNNDPHDDQVDALAASFDALDRHAGLSRARTVKSGFGTGPLGGNPYAPSGAVKWS